MENELEKLIIEGATGLEILNDVISTWNKQERLENWMKKRTQFIMILG